jgi:hypothetical protein
MMSAAHKEKLHMSDNLSVLRILNGSGDTSVTWDPERLAASDPEAEAAVREAERLFAQARASGAVAFRINANEPATRLDAFDPTAKETLVIPAMVGG